MDYFVSFHGDRRGPPPRPAESPLWGDTSSTSNRTTDATRQEEGRGGTWRDQRRSRKGFHRGRVHDGQICVAPKDDEKPTSSLWKRNQGV